MKEIDEAVKAVFDRFHTRHEEAESRGLTFRDDRELSVLDAERAADEAAIREQLERVAKAAAHEALCLAEPIVKSAVLAALRRMAEEGKEGTDADEVHKG